MAFQIPSKIYLQVQDIDTDEPIQSLDGCTWCADRIMRTDVEYELAGENERLREVIAAALAVYVTEDWDALHQIREILKKA